MYFTPDVLSALLILVTFASIHHDKYPECQNNSNKIPLLKDNFEITVNSYCCELEGTHWMIMFTT